MQPIRSGTLALATVTLLVFGSALVAAHPPEHAEPVPVQRLNLISSDEGGLALDENASRTASAEAVYEFESDSGLPCCSWWYDYEEPVEEALPVTSEDFRLADEIGAVDAVLAIEWFVDDFEEPLNFWGDDWYLYVELVVHIACDTYRSGFEITEREGAADVPLTMYGEHRHADAGHAGHGNESEACVTPTETWSHDVKAFLYLHPGYPDSLGDYVQDEYVRISFDVAGGSFVELPVFVPEVEEPVVEEAESAATAAPAEEPPEESVPVDEAVMTVPAPGVLPFVLAALGALAVARRRHS